MERDVAIVGMACIFPRAPDLATYWRNLRDGVDAITDVPAARWDPAYYDPASTAPDRFYARRGGFIDDYATFDAAAFGIMPIAAQGAEPDQLLALEVATAALADAGYADRAFPRARTDVVLGRGNYLGPAMLRLVNITRGGPQLVDALRSLLPDAKEDELAAVKREFQARCGVYGPDTAIGLVPNLVASRIANRLDLGGSAYTLDAACASTLVAVDHACRSLLSASADLVLAGGVHLCHDPVFWSVFSQLGALSRDQQIRPFDRRADGLLIGEGLGMLVLKRAADARRDGDRVYAVIRGVGLASDGRDVSLMTPRVEGQLLALERAWTAAGLSPATLGFLEAHGTATPAGDAAEIATLGRFFGPAPTDAARIPVGSVKSMIGHAMPASGAAGLIKAALAVYHGVRLPTLHCDEPNPALDATRFRPLAVAEPWDADIRRAAVNAFGFGGINAHVIVDAEPAPARVRRGTSLPDDAGPAAADAAPVTADAGPVTADAFLAAAATTAALAQALDRDERGGAGPARVALFEPTPERRARALAAIAAGRPRHGRDGIHVTPQGLIAAGGKVAFLFPGIEAEFAPEVESLARGLGVAPPDVAAPDLEHQALRVLLLSRFLLRAADAVGLRPDLLAGHSIGEWSGMVAAGMFDEAATERFIDSLRPGTSRVADVRYVAAGTGRARLEALFAAEPDVAITHDNCNHQAILCAPAARTDAVAAKLRAQRVLFEVLPFRSGFHSPALADHVDFYVRNLEALPFTPARVPLWSATTCAPYPAEPAAIRALFAEHLTKPVRFRELVEALYAEGARVFVQMGTGSLPAFVDDVLAGRPHLAVSLLSARRPGREQFQRACAALFVEGADLDLVRAGLAPAAATGARRRALKLELGVPLVHVDLESLRPHAVPATPAAATPAGDPLALAFAETMSEIARAQDAVMRALGSGRRAAPPNAPAPPAERTDRLPLSLATHPELVDHMLVPQPRGWPEPEDGMPSVPMTMSVELIREAAQRLDPARLPVAVENVQAKTWLRVVPPVEVEVTARRVDADRIHVRIDKYVEGTVVMRDRYAPPPPAAPLEIGTAREFPVGVPAIYDDGWLFHGPGYRGVVSIDGFGDAGIGATLTVLPAKGALLDAAGQLVGLHLAFASAKDRLALPVRIGRVEWFDRAPPPGTPLACRVAIRHAGFRDLRADLDVLHGDRVLLRVTGWEDWRFQTGDGLWDLMREPATRLLASIDPRGFAMIADPGWATATYDYLIRRYVGAAESAVYGGSPTLQRERSRLLGRIAAKDAVRAHLFARGQGPLFPVEVRIDADEAGRPLVRGPFAGDVRVSIAHCEGMACALAAEGTDPGIDVEKIESRGDAFAALAFAASELARVPADARDEWITRMWAAKEAAGKARGTGLEGRPKELAITNVEGERIMIDGRWVETTRMGDFIVAWTR
ncbi:MAG: polyketide synthase dehydratase domain-containing protein [Betaproteobacteria bacterium]|nr:polyketide synthase dehydratase domain-containing protein [Betaproteobacteria bacterium]